MKRLILFLVLAASCSSSSEAPRVERPVFAGDLPAPATNDLGWAVELTQARVAMTDVVFTTEGEGHVALLDRLSDALVPPAYAHPGHLAGGEAIGELSGVHVVDFGSEAELGIATLIVGRYDGANFTFVQHDDLGGASLELTGTATRDDVVVDWTARVTQDADRTVVGLPMDVDLSDDVAALELRLLIVDPTDDEDTVFDGIDFGTEPSLEIGLGSEAANRLVRATQRHDFWQVEVSDR